MFNDIIVQNFSDPTHALELDQATDEIELGNPVCGDRIKVQLQIANGRIQRAAYGAWGCATSLATGNIFCRRIEDMSLQDAAQLESREIDQMLGELDPSQHHCLEMLHTLFGRLRELVAHHHEGTSS